MKVGETKIKVAQLVAGGCSDSNTPCLCCLCLEFRKVRLLTERKFEVFSRDRWPE